MGLWDDIEVNGVYGTTHERSYEDVLGAAIEEILGASAAGRPASSNALAKSPAFQQALARKLAARAPVTKQVPPTKKRRWPIGFVGSGASGTTQSIRVQPQCLFRGEKLIATSDQDGTGRNTLITGIFVGNKPQLPLIGTDAPIPTSSFLRDALDNEMMFDTCQPSQFITFQVSMATDNTWRATLWGHIVQG